MENTRGPVIFAGLYAACILLTILALLMHERFGATEFKSWAPFVQAVLSAGAIFSAWWLQSAKRDADRREARLDTEVILIAGSYHLMAATAYVVELSIEDKLGSTNLSVHKKKLIALMGFLESTNIAHLPERAVWPYYGFREQMLQFTGLMEDDINRVEKDVKRFPELYASTYAHLWNARDDLLSKLGRVDRYAPLATPADMEQMENSAKRRAAES